VDCEIGHGEFAKCFFFQCPDCEISVCQSCVQEAVGCQDNVSVADSPILRLSLFLAIWFGECFWREPLLDPSSIQGERP
jgi:hypothetical protein